MQIKFWGVRGSLPSAQTTEDSIKHIERLMNQFFDLGFTTKSDISKFIHKFAPPQLGGFGSSTTCIQIESNDQFIVIDGGSGLKYVSDNLFKSGKIATINEFHIFMSHFHFDHIIGIPFFAPHFMKNKIIHYYSVLPNTEQIVRSLFAKPVFPVTYEQLTAKINFHQIENYKPLTVNGFKITSYKLDHPDPCSGFRVEQNGKVYAHAVDHEVERRTHEQLGPDAALFENADLLYIDAQYEESEMIQKKGWGHGTCPRGFEVADRFHVKNLLFAHHEPASKLAETLKMREHATEYFKANYPHSKLNWDFAYEGQTVKI